MFEENGYTDLRVEYISFLCQFLNDYSTEIEISSILLGILTELLLVNSVSCVEIDRLDHRDRILFYVVIIQNPVERTVDMRIGRANIARRFR